MTGLAAARRALSALAEPWGAARPWALLYLCAGAGALLAGALAVDRAREPLEGVLARALLPAPFAEASLPLLRATLAAQADTVFAQLAVAVGLACVSALLFPLKERLSQAFERGRSWAPPGEPAPALPLWREALDELCLLLICLSAQVAVLWVGLSPSPTRRALAVAAGGLLLCLQLTADFGPPALQRRGLGLWRALLRLFSTPLSALAFGAAFALPTQLLAALLLPVRADHPLLWAGAQGAVTLLAATLAVLAGTRLAAESPAPLDLPQRATPRERLAAAALAAFVASQAVAAALALTAVAQTSQLLKCRYRLVPGSAAVQAGLLDAWLSGAVHVEARVALEIENPTPLAVDLSRVALELRRNGAVLAAPILDAVAVPGGATRRVELTLDLPVDAAALRGAERLGGDLLAALGGAANPYALAVRLHLLPGAEVTFHLGADGALAPADRGDPRPADPAR